MGFGVVVLVMMVMLRCGVFLESELVVWVLVWLEFMVNEEMGGIYVFDLFY